MCEKTQPAEGMYQAGHGLYLGEELRIRSNQYSPLLVIMMLEMYAHPERRSYYLYGTLPPAQLEVMELLRRAKIVVPALTPPVLGAAQMWEVDEEALRVYSSAVCNIGLPRKHWVPA